MGQSVRRDTVQGRIDPRTRSVAGHTNIRYAMIGVSKWSKKGHIDEVWLYRMYDCLAGDLPSITSDTT